MSMSRLEAAEAAETAAQLEVQTLLRQRCAVWAQGGGLVIDPEADSVDDSEAGPGVGPEADPEAWLRHPGAIRRHLARTHGSLQRILTRGAPGVHHGHAVAGEQGGAGEGEWGGTEGGEGEIEGEAGGLGETGGEGGGQWRPLARVHDFLPADVARWAAAALVDTPEHLWEPTGVAGASRFSAHKTLNPGP